MKRRGDSTHLSQHRWHLGDNARLPATLLTQFDDVGDEHLDACGVAVVGLQQFAEALDVEVHVRLCGVWCVET